ncbi:mechanosensitive ion channel protein MscS [Cupriavidus sp. USMAA2-4]|uniref:Small-conductance mechanosensitive channel n=1 Tax=Cupriavidus malaysiensis TaxID=367825 RepID=A0ABN4TLU5_9BURK|nr:MULTISPECIES: mechanosensitive ion channel domain-containing protein [Cupriavidus]AOY95117.1 mechanosensitive ion channel protein MscS [Cupriavidus sp. USMAA2-4]AOZ01986.1 mechanosensitive ion channel protein MscS [Cupriavidus sp. USMAHM13]AOZ08279.1 mechanosensitive ion channel protein MscS [Cupriavidus malaysiensis]
MNLNIIEADKLQAAWTYLLQSAVQQGLNLLAALLILIVGWWLSARAAGAVRRIFERSGIDVTLRPMLASATQWIVRVLTLVLVLSQFGVQTASIIAMLGAAGLAIGLALQGTLQNIAAGIMLVLLRPFRVGQYIDAQGVAGTVRETGLFMTELTTADGVCLRVPNGKLWGSAITNYSENPTRRLDIEATVAFGSDLQAALAALRAMLAAEPRLLAEPRAEAMVINYAPQGITLNVRCWTASADYWGVRFDFYGRIEATLAAAGYPLALPLQELRMPAGAGPLAGAADPGAGTPAPR